MATRERTTSNTAIITVPEVEVAERQPQEIPDVFQAMDTPQVPKRFWSTVGHWAQKYGEFKLTTGYWNQFRI
ncbi:MAG: hypothetical protein BZY75_02495 [SAR202 cluster bacterium Io17-Chloro-G7]|nr:MAG: hypothetical protein BZY75_02495 [SAR202 cluster bacterium Io17-Chloro-G7]